MDLNFFFTSFLWIHHFVKLVGKKTPNLVYKSNAIPTAHERMKNVNEQCSFFRDDAEKFLVELKKMFNKKKV